MFYCKECGNIFTSPHIERARRGFSFGLCEELSLCPYCGRNRYRKLGE